MLPIHRFAAAGDVEGIARELASGVPADLPDADTRYTPLMSAVESDDAEVSTLRFLLEQGASIDAKVDETPVLSVAIRAGNVEKVRFLLDAGADILYMKPSGYDAVVEAIFSRSTPQNQELILLFQLLIERGARLNTVSDYGESALSVASRLGRFDVIIFLLEAGADPAPLEWTDLMRAAAIGTLEDVEHELSQGADVTAVDRWERTPWLLSLQTGDLAKVKLLASVSDRESRGWGGSTALMLAVENDQAEVLSWLLAQGEDLNAKSEYGKTPLMVAAEQGATECVRLLLQAGARVDLTDEMGQTLREVLEDVERIIPSEGDGELTWEDMLEDEMDEAMTGETAIAKASNLEIVRLLVVAGADLNEISDEMRAELTGLETEGEVECSAEEYAQGKQRRYGKSNPEVMHVPFWNAMVRSGVTGWRARCTFKDTEKLLVEEWTEEEETQFENDPVWGFYEGPMGRKPVWCFHRFGKSITELPDGRIIEIGGEHEDYGDPDFCIYNDVFVHHGGGRFDILGYPYEVFPPTDFHSATLVGEFIYIIGSTGYMEARMAGETPVYRFHCDSLVIEKVETSGDNPGWIGRHKAVYSPAEGLAGEIRISGGNVCAVIDGEGQYLENHDDFVLDLGTMHWRRVA